VFIYGGTTHKSPSGSYYAAPATIIAHNLLMWTQPPMMGDKKRSVLHGIAVAERSGTLSPVRAQTYYSTLPQQSSKIRVKPTSPRVYDV